MIRPVALLLVLIVAGCAPAKTEPEGIAERYSGEAVADPALSQTILVDTYSYWDAISSKDWKAAYGQFTLDYQRKVPFTEWQRIPHDAWARRPVIRSIHWTKGTHRQHGPELYAIVEWSARSGSSGSEGALIWRQQPDGSFLLENTIVRKLLRPKR